MKWVATSQRPLVTQSANVGEQITQNGVAVGIFGLISKEKREAIRSKREYDECYRSWREKILSFRSNAIRELKTKHPDACFLINNIDRRFLAIIESQGTLLVGKCADDYYARLEYVGETASTSERDEAVARFRRDVRGSLGNISPANLPRFRQSSKWLSDKTTESFKSNGFAITGSVELKYLVGGSVFLDGKRIASSSIWNPERPGYFAEAIIPAILLNVKPGPGTHYLGFLTADSNPIGEGGIISYELALDSVVYHPVWNGKLSSPLQNFLDFLSYIERYFGPNSPVADSDKLEYTSETAAAVLEKYGRDDDESIDSRSLL